MKLGFPRLGTFHVFSRPALRLLGVELVVAPPSSRRTLDLGVQHNPEMICAPCKLLFGNYVEALEQGVDGLVMLGGPGTCRLGYSARAQEALLRRMGYQFTAYTIDLYHMRGEAVRIMRALAQPSWGTLVETMRFMFDLIDLVDQVDKATLRIRPLEREPGTVDRLREETLQRIMALPDRATLRRRRKEWLHAFEAIPCHGGQPLRVAVVGDLYTMMEPFFNMRLERELGSLGVHVERGFWLSDGTRELPRSILIPARRDVEKLKAAQSYLAHDIGGFAQSTVGEAALWARSGVDGLIHLAPFNCTPEIMAHNALLALQREHRVPLLSLSFDEHTGQAGLLTRLEAFVDLLQRRRQRQAAAQERR